MTRKARWAAVILAAALAGAARTTMAATVYTPAMQPGSDQMLVCTVVNLSGEPLAITVQVMDRWRENVTCYVRTDWDETETVLLTVYAEATSPHARYCKVTVKGGRKTDVSASIQACSYDLTECTAPVVAR